MNVSDLYKRKGNIIVVKSHGHCAICPGPKVPNPFKLVRDRWVSTPTIPDALFSVNLDNHHGAWGNVCLQHWLESISLEHEGPILGTGIGQFLMHDKDVPVFSFQGHTINTCQAMFGNDERYTMLVRGNTIVKTETRQYKTLEEQPDVVSCIFDIQTRLIPHESDRQQGGIKIWLQKARGGHW